MNIFRIIFAVENLVPSNFVEFQLHLVEIIQNGLLELLFVNVDGHRSG